MNKKSVFVISMLFLGILPFLYNNCSAQHDPSSRDFSSASDCDPIDEFARGFHPFLRNNCVSCHVPGGVGKGVFAAGDIQMAFEAFELAGYSMVSDYAVNPAHQPPYTGAQHTETINTLKLDWSRALERREICQGGSAQERVDVSNWIQTKSQGLNILENGQSEVLSWNLEQDLLDNGAGLPPIERAVFQVTATLEERGGRKYYILSQPTLDLRNNSNQDLRVRGLKFRINGNYINNDTTFTFLNRAVRRGTREQNLSSGSSVAPSDFRARDVIALSFGELILEELPPAPPGPRVNFRLASQEVMEGDGEVEVWVELSEPIPSHTVVVGLQIEGESTAIPLRSGRSVRLRDETGGTRDLVINSFDWDYDFDSLGVVFLPNETSKRIRLNLAEHERYQPPRLLSLRIGSVVGAEVGEVGNYSLTINNANPAPAIDEITFSMLMRPGGVFYEYCLTCHNSADKRGGLDLANFREMIDREVLIPEDTNSLMYIRMSTQSGTQPPMPLTGILPSHIRGFVEQWILSGAKNN